jgi:hypothetical protein
LAEVNRGAGLGSGSEVWAAVAVCRAAARRSNQAQVVAVVASSIQAAAYTPKVPAEHAEPDANGREADPGADARGSPCAQGGGDLVVQPTGERGADRDEQHRQDDLGRDHGDRIVGGRRAKAGASITAMTVAVTMAGLPPAGPARMPPSPTADIRPAKQ